MNDAISSGRHRQMAMGLCALAALAMTSRGAPAARAPFEVPVLVLSYFPTNGDLVDVRVTGDWGAPLADTRAKTQRQTREVIEALEQGSRYHGYTNPAAKPSLKYRVAGEMEFLKPLPTVSKRNHRTPMTDYARIMADVSIRDWVEQRGVREVWIWGYHGGKVDLWESNMSSPSGDVSNSDRDPNDLPVLDRTYTVYHYNYQRGTSEAVEDHLHQIEAVLNAIDGRDRTPASQWTNLLFWGKFVGSDRTHKMVSPGCGWSHYPPNAERDYDWANPRFVLTDIEDWQPDGTGRQQRLNCERWGGNSLKWFVYWMQNLPGQDNPLTYQGRRLRNWWLFMGDYDTAKRAGMKLAESSFVSAAPWPQFRGPTGLGFTSETNLPLSWNAKTGENVLWQSPLVGQGHASPIVWGDAVFLSTVRWPSNSLSRESVIPEHHVTCYQAGDGKMHWDTVVPPGPWLRNDFRSGPGGGYAAPTPATDGQRVYCAFGSSVLAALDFQGHIVWGKEILPASFDVTVGSSPIVYQDTVLLLCAMAKPADSRVVAFDRSSGAVKWQQSFSDMAFGHSTPVIIAVNSKPQMLVLASGMSIAGNALRSLDPATGQTLWWCRGAGDAASPAFGAGVVYFDSGRGGQAVAVDPSGSGDVSSTHVRWTVAQVPEGIGSPIIIGQQVYRLHSPGILKCWDAATGKLLYAERLEGLSTTWASPIADAAGHLFFANAGKSYVIQAGPEFRVLAVNDLGDGNHPSPAVANGKLFLAGLKSLYCIAR